MIGGEGSGKEWGTKGKRGGGIGGSKDSEAEGAGSVKECGEERGRGGGDITCTLCQTWYQCIAELGGNRVLEELNTHLLYVRAVRDVGGDRVVVVVGVVFILVVVVGVAVEVVPVYTRLLSAILPLWKFTPLTHLVQTKIPSQSSSTPNQPSPSTLPSPHNLPKVTPRTYLPGGLPPRFTPLLHEIRVGACITESVR